MIDKSEYQHNMNNMLIAKTLIAGKNLKYFQKYRRSLPGDASLFENDKHRLVRGCRKIDQAIIAGDGPKLKESVNT